MALPTDVPRMRPGHTEPPYPQDPTTATRHLCAGAYLDDEFRATSLREVYYQSSRLVAPSYGFDLAPVLGHCLKARNAVMVRDALIVAVLTVVACAAFTSLLGVVLVLAWLHVTVATYQLARDTFRRLRSNLPLETETLVPRATLLGLGWLAVTALGAVLLFDDLLGTATNGSGYGFEPAPAESAAAGFGVTVALTLLVAAIPVTFILWRQSELSRLAPGNPVTPPVRNARLDEIARQQRGNTAVYSGFRPYVGSGERLETWGFAQRLVRPEPAEPWSPEGRPRRALTEQEREFAEPPFTAEELIDSVRAHLRTLVPNQHTAEEQIDGLTVEDRVLLAGTEVSHLAPYTEPEVLTAIMRHPTTPARHYLVCQVFSWGGELITTVYVHIAVQGRSLYLELTTTVLPPCAEAYRVVSTVEGQGAGAWLRALREGVAETPRAVWRAPIALAGSLFTMAMSSGGAGPVTRGYDHGARIGVRELGSDLRMRNRMQIQDVEKYQKLIERRVIASVLDFLDERGVDTTEYRNRAAAVLNVSGGVNNFGRAAYHGPVGGQSASGGKS